jgi:hypothetical protein
VADGPGSARIFICYRRADASGTAGRLYDRLVTHFGERDVFFDVSMRPGDVFSAEIQAALESCQVLLALIGPGWLTAVDASGRPRLADPDDLLVREIRTLLDRGGRVVPVLLDGARLPAVDELPAELAGMTRYQAFSVDQTSFDWDIAALAAALDRILGVTPHGRSGQTPEPEPENGPRLTVWIPVIVAVIALIATIAAALITRSSMREPAASTAAACSALATMSPAPVRPNPRADTHDVTLLSAGYVVDRGVRPATITVAGRVAGAAPPGSHLWVVQKPNAATYDSTPARHAGSGRYYPAGEIIPDAHGCFVDTPQSVGYDEALGITFDQLFVQVDDAASADFADRDAWLKNDGYAADDLGQLRVDTIAFFSAPTA